MIVITGASKGIGRFLLERFINDNNKVLGTYNSTSVESLKYRDVYHRLNITDVNAIQSWISSIRDQLNSIVLINCAGISYSTYAHKADLDLWSNVIHVNLVGTFNVIRNLLPIMREQNYGRIINFSSVVGSLPTPGVSAYAASKSALNGLAKSLAIESALKGITVNNIELGYAEIGMGINEVTVEFEQIIKERIPSREFCNPDDIYESVKFLIKTEYINGASIKLNGGLV